MKPIVSGLGGLVAGVGLMLAAGSPKPKPVQLPRVIQPQTCACYDPASKKVTKLIPEGKPLAASDCDPNEQIRCGKHLEHRGK